MDTPPAPRRTNRRLTARITCHLTVSYRTDEDWHPATAMDLSRNGCRLRLGESLERGGALAVRIIHPGRGEAPALTAEVEGRVVWSRLEGLSHQVGIQFLADSAELHEVLAAIG
jgi:hypothetical protein